MKKDISLSQQSIEEQYEIGEDGKYTDLPRSNLPAAKDDINEMQDLTLDLIEARNSFYNYINLGNLSEAEQVLEQNPTLLSCLFNADKYNSLRDSIIALQRLYLDDIEKYIMTLSTPQGEWQEDTEYKKYQVVSYIDDDATQIYAARQMIVPANSVSEFDTRPTNTYYWTPITLRGKQGTPGLGLTPMGEWKTDKNYYNYIDTSNLPIVSFVYYDNILWQAISNNLNSKPTYQVIEGKYISTNENWEIIMSLNQGANTILMPYGDSIADVINKFDNRSKGNLEDLIGEGYIYTANKTSLSPVTWEEKATTNGGEVYASKTSIKISEKEWNIEYSCPTSELNYTIKYIKDENGNWKGVKI